MKFKQTCLKLLLCVICIANITAAYAVTAADDDDSGSDDQIESVAITGKSHDAIGNMLLQSISLMGIPYRWGGNTPQTGMDCSGFIRYVFQKSMGITLPRTAAEMAKVGKRVSLDDLEPGDLLFFNTRRGSNTHIGMYIGNNQFIQSPHTGDHIKITELDSSWRAKLNGAKRIVQEDQDDEGDTTIESYQDITDEGLPVAYRHGRGRCIRHRHHRCVAYAHTTTGNKRHGVHVRSGHNGHAVHKHNHHYAKHSKVHTSKSHHKKSAPHDVYVNY